MLAIVVEPDDMTFTVIKSALARVGWMSERLESWNRALRASSDERVAFVDIDALLSGGLSGPRAIPGIAPDTVVIAICTTHSRDRLSNWVGIDGVLQKPVDEQAVLDALADGLLSH